MLFVFAARGNTTVCAEFNFAADPEAAYIVLNRFFCPTYIATWEFCCENKLPWVRAQVLVIYLYRLNKGSHTTRLIVNTGPALTSEQMGGNETRREGLFQLLRCIHWLIDNSLLSKYLLQSFYKYFTYILFEQIDLSFLQTHLSHPSLICTLQSFCDNWLAQDSDKARFMKSIFKHTMDTVATCARYQREMTAGPGFLSCDSYAAIDDGFVWVAVTVELQGTYTRGMMVLDKLGVLEKEHQVVIMRTVDLESFMDSLK